MPSDVYPNTRVATVQASPVFLDRDATIQKVRKLTEEAKFNGADLVVFSESFIPTFPVWCLFMAPIDQHGFYKRLFENAVTIPSPAFYELQRIARENQIFLSVGVTEKGTNSMGAMWNTNLIFDRQGNMISRHRKILPTWAEKLVWANGDGSSLNVHDTEIGKIGTLICGENTNTLARYALLSQGEQIHIQTHPPCWPTTRAKGNYFECLRTRAAAHSFEGKVYCIMSSATLDEQAIEEMSMGDQATKEWLENSSWATSMITGPNGLPLAGPITDNKEGILYADCDISQEIHLKGIHDIVGAYQRFDIFQVNVNKSVLEPAYFHDDRRAPSRDFYPYTEIEDVIE